MFISSRSETRGLKRLIWLKYFHVQNWQITFTLRLTTAKNTNYMEKSSKIKLFRIKFPTKKSVGPCVYLPQKWSKGAQKIDIVEVL